MKTTSVARIQYVICLGAFLSNLSAGMFNIALLDISRDFQSTMTSTQWVVAIYLLTISVCLPLMGSLGDGKGKRTVHNLGLLIFAAGGLLCALSNSLPALILFRIVQGIGASMYQANNMALVVSLFPPERRGRALGTVSTFVAAGALIGPSLGGMIIQWLSWRANFWLLAAVALGTWLLAQRFIPADRTAGSGAPDYPGAALFAVALTSMVTALNLGTSQGWASGSVWLLLGLAVLFGAWFARRSLSPRWERAAEGSGPFIRLTLFNHPYIGFGVLLTILTYAAAFGTQLVLPVILRNVMGIPPAGAGLIVMAYPASLIFSAPLSGTGSDRFGSAPLIIAGLGSMAVSLAAFSFLSADSHTLYVIAVVVLLGWSMGLITSPNNSIVMSRTPKQNLGLMSSMIALCRNLGMMLGAAVGGLLLSTEPGAGTATAAALSGFSHSIRDWYMAMAMLIVAALLVFLWVTRYSDKKAAAMHGRGNQRETMV
ncbi:MFS transporter [Paenibacillus aurantius]|uniref:MFS transporter n=1 Tax=Paenibacillus aurantius TaxID=2918900 RepID=A0AA96LHJ1_9BACL|nr:MFS transporter [Paenibacillus aurantius]WNQ13098.1 MFS transporter [Paenibacillus aurantius]